MASSTRRGPVAGEGSAAASADDEGAAGGCAAAEACREAAFIGVVVAPGFVPWPAAGLVAGLVAGFVAGFAKAGARSDSRISAPTMSGRPSRLASACARTTPDSEHSSVTASAA